MELNWIFYGECCNTAMKPSKAITQAVDDDDYNCECYTMNSTELAAKMKKKFETVNNTTEIFKHSADLNSCSCKNVWN